MPLSHLLYNKSLKYLDGDGVRKDPVEAFRLNSEAAADGMHDAVLAMGWFYCRGIGVELDVEEAKRWYKKSARQKDLRAMFSLGEIAYDQKDYEDAVVWFKRAIEAGHVRSLYWMGMLHWKGLGVRKDRQLAQRLFRQAAEKKVYEAQRLFSLWNYVVKKKLADIKTPAALP